MLLYNDHRKSELKLLNKIKELNKNHVLFPLALVLSKSYLVESFCLYLAYPVDYTLAVVF